MKNKCAVCNNYIDKFYIWGTPDGKKYKVCRKCQLIARAFETSFNNNVEENK